MRIIDLSQEIYEGMPVYAGHLETKVWQHHRFEDTAPNFDSDFAYQSLGITFCDHGPTHVDALSHLDPRPGAPTIDRMDLAQFCGRDAAVFFRSISCDKPPHGSDNDPDNSTEPESGAPSVMCDEPREQRRRQAAARSYSGKDQAIDEATLLHGHPPRNELIRRRIDN